MVYRPDELMQKYKEEYAHIRRQDFFHEFVEDYFDECKPVGGGHIWEMRLDHLEEFVLEIIDATRTA